MQPPKNRFQILILHPKKHSYIQYKEINTFFNAYKLKKMPFRKTDKKIFILEALIRRP